MATVIPRTVRESLYWSYANLAMAFTGGRHDESTYQQIDYIVRNKLYYVFGDNYPSALTTIRIPGVAGGNFLLPGGGQNGRRP